MRVLGIDLETRSKEDIKKAGGYRYAENCEILLFAYAYDEDPVQVIDMASGEEIPRFVISDILDNPDVLKVAYNAQFERTVLSNYFRKKNMLTGWLDARQWLCTMVLGMTLGLPSGLDALGKVLGLSEDKAKMAIGKKLIQKFCKPDRKGNFVLPSEAPEDWKTFIEYNRRDVETERTLRKMMWKYVPSPTERKLWALDQRINDRGVHIDQKLAENAIAIDTECRDEVMEEARELTGLQNPSSNAQLKTWLQEQEGWDEPPASLTKTTIPELIEKCKNEDCKRALELKLKLGKTSTKKYQTMLDTVCKDGNVHGLLQFYGASRTGRWAGRLVQTQNLPRCYLEDLDDARGTVLLGDREIMEFLYENIPDTLSQLIRTAFTASPGCRFIDADFSAIEARVIAWLAKEEWRQEVFRKNGDIYCASASQMFHVPVEKHGINGHLRQKGKIAELALGYNGSIGALKNMGADKMGLSDEELKSIVTKWRAASPHIVKLWHDAENAAINAVQNAGKSFAFGTNCSFIRENDILFMQLPSGRRIAYFRPEIEEGDYGPELAYHGVNQTTRQWTKLRTYGGKLTENCIAEGTLVLTERGLMPIELIQRDTKIWDGEEFVSHDGLIKKGMQPVIFVDGLLMTKEHKILTKEGWVEANESSGLDWADVRLPESYPQSRIRKRKSKMALPMHLWKARSPYRMRPDAQRAFNKVMRLHEEQDDRRRNSYTRNDTSSGLRGMAFDDSKMHGANAQSMEELRRPRNHGLRKMAPQLPKLLGRHESDVSKWARARQDKQQRGIFPGKLPLDNQKKEFQEQANEYHHRYATRKNDDLRVFGKDGNRDDNDLLPHSTSLANGIVVHDAGLQKQVYDIRNCGPRHQFVVYDQRMKAFRVVHNCTQSIARDCLATAMMRLDKAGYPIVMHIHDEMVADMPEGKGSIDDAVRIMSEPIPWAPGLILNADGWEDRYFKKE